MCKDCIWIHRSYPNNGRSYQMPNYQPRENYYSPFKTTATKVMLEWAEHNGWPEISEHERISYSTLKEIELAWNVMDQPHFDKPNPPYDQGDEIYNDEWRRRIESEMGRHVPGVIWDDERFMPDGDFDD